ncbi:hypothetical protein DFH06DRAFT_752203 [Mycena polygramma]|nr:hypothetical protein DFH06DRAFT_752203 [Mycena polygramma]
MHRSLQIPEVVALICRETVPHIERESRFMLDSRTSARLATLARTCKAFSSPALDLLWRNQRSLVPILRCMPDDVWDKDDFECLRRPIVPTDWERPLVYSHRVKSFKYADELWGQSPEFFETLRLCFPGERLFPNLESLDWVASSEPASMPYARLFLGPHLTLLTLGYLASAAHVSFLSTVTARCPLLTEVEIVFTDEMELAGQFQSLSLLVRGLNRLEKLTVPSLDRAALAHLAQLPAFECLTLTNQVPTTPGLVPTSNDHPFASLQSLEITATTVEALTEIIPLFTHAPMDDIVATFLRLPASHLLSQLYADLATRCSHSHASLSMLRLGRQTHADSIPDAAQSAVHVVHGAQLRPLFAFSNLTFVTLSAPVGFDIDDAVIADMARSWPNIEVLKLHASDFAPVPSRLTLSSLLLFARHCPYLRTLHLGLDASTVPDWEAFKADKKKKKKGGRVRQNVLGSLYMSRSPIEEPLTVAAFLSNIFPKLKFVSTDKAYIETPSQDTIAMHMQWKIVEAALPVLRKVRAEERYWARA